MGYWRSRQGLGFLFTQGVHICNYEGIRPKNAILQKELRVPFPNGCICGPSGLAGLLLRNVKNSYHNGYI